MVAPIGYGSEGPYRIPSPQHLLDISFFLATRLYCFAFVSLSLQKNVRDASSEHDTIRRTTWHNSSSPDAVFCRNTSAEDTRRNDSETMCAVVLLTKSPSWLFSCCLLDSVVAAVFLYDGRWRRSRRGGRGLRRSQSSGGLRCRTHPTSGIRLRVLFRALLAETGPGSSLSLCVRTDPVALACGCAGR